MKKIEIIFKNYLLSILLFFNKKDEIKNKEGEKLIPKKVLFIRLNRIGDALVTTPLLKLLKDKLNIEIHILADKKNYFIYEKQGFVDFVYVYQKGLKGFIQYTQILKKEKYDIVVDLHDDVSTTVSFLLALSKNCKIYGLKKKNIRLYTNTVERLDSSKFHVIDRIMELTKLFNVNFENEDINICFYSNENDFLYVDKFIENNYKTKKTFVGINISAGSDARFWGINRFRQLVDYFNSFDVNVVIFCTTREIKTAFDISRGNVPIFYTHEFSTISAFISKLSFFFTPDTSSVHLASMYKIPVYGLYVKYNTNDVIWYSYKSIHKESITTESTLNNMEFEEVINDLKPFFEKIYNAK
ncbi:MAG: glycosyltransferase family 9 protein [bacterium]